MKRVVGGIGLCGAVLLLAMAQGAHAFHMPCGTHLAGRGLVDPAFGFPKYYIDSTGVALGPCLDFVCDPALGLPDPNQPVSFPGNFPVEVFYHRAISQMTGPNGQTFLLVMALEGSFLNGVVPVDGEQVVFTRVRVRATGVVPNATYTVTHPYGVETLVANGLPPRLINFTRDVGTVPLAFDLALNGDVGPFLRFATGAPPPPGSIGNPAGNQTVTGSTCGTNIFKVEGPGLPAGGVQTNVFSTIIGKIAPVCGNGVVDATEQCDDGNTLAGDCCSPTCQFEPAGTACDDGNVCTTNLSGCGGAGQCVVTGFTTLACNDGNACTTADTCAGGLCVGGPALNCNDNNACTADSCAPATGCVHTDISSTCNDGNLCTTDTCNPTLGCVHANNTVSCDDGNACTTDDRCNGGGACVGGAAPNCNDANLCTDDTCSPPTGCVHGNNAAPCDDGNACTIGDVCGAGTCTGGGARNCNDGNACTADTCAPALGCQHANIPGPCDDGNACTTNDGCSTGVCIGGPALNCNDGNVCTVDACNVTTGCLHTNNTASCDDGNACTTSDTCGGGTCVGGSARNCDDTNPCTNDSCNPATSCVHTNNTASCNDGNPCTTNDQCGGGVCGGGGALNCDDTNPCTTDACNPATGCTHTNNSNSCDDGNVCTTTDTCSGGQCVGGPPPSCNDGNGCTDDACVVGSGCVHTNNTVPCNDASVCTTVDRCGGGVCVGSTPLDCDDANPCTTDSCNPATGCAHANNSNSCDDGNVCTTNDACSGGGCVAGPPLNCSDGNGCTDDACVPGSGCAHTNNTAPCNDANLCTTVDRCSGGVCIGNTPPDCDDGNGCTDDTCSPASGCLNVNNAAACDDGNVCTTQDRCSGGSCGGGPAPDCDDDNPCTADSCLSGVGCRHTNVSVTCDDGNACTTNDTCSGGVCLGGTPPDCNDGNLCTNDGCDPATGCTQVANDVSCDDQNPCTTSDSCRDGACAGGPPRDCDDGDVCTDDGCSPTTGCTHTANTATCEDGDPATVLDQCANGACIPGVLACPASPLARCRSAVSPQHAQVLLTRGVDRAHDRFLWKWRNGAATAKEDFTNPTVEGGTAYFLCMYEETDGGTRLSIASRLPAGGSCNGTPCWKEMPTGFRYSDRTASHAPGMASVAMKAGADGRALIMVKGAGAGLSLPSLPLGQQGKVTVQLIGRAACFQAEYTAPALVNTAEQFRDSGD